MVMFFLGLALIQGVGIHNAFSEDIIGPPPPPGTTEQDTAKSSGNVTKDALQSIASVASIIIQILTFLSLLILDYGGTLIGTDMITGQAVMEAIRPMWVIVRNLTNIGFVVVLLFLAFANLFSFGEGNWTIKEKLPRVITALIAINFSLLTFKVVIDAVHVGTISLLSISDTALQARDADGLQKLMGQRFDKTTYETCVGTKEQGCLSFTEMIDQMFCTEKNADGSVKKDSCLFSIGKGYTAESVGKGITVNNESARNLFLAFGVFFQHLERLPMLSAKLADWDGVLDNVLFSGIMALAFIVALVCVFLALLVRVAILWVAMIFSPLIFAGGIMGLGDGASTVTDMMFKALIMPLKIAGAFAVTFVMLTALSDVNFSGEAGDLIELGPALSQFGTNMYGILWQIMTVVIFWKVAFWALEGSPISGMIIDKIKAGAETAGGYIAKTATVDQTVIPTIGGGKAIGLSALAKFPDVLGRIRSRRMEEQEQELYIAMGGDKDVAEARKAIGDELEKLGTTGFDGSINKLIDFLSRHGLKTVREGGEVMWDKIAKASSGISGLTGEDIKKALKDSTDETKVRGVFNGKAGVDKELVKKIGQGPNSGGAEITEEEKFDENFDSSGNGTFKYTKGDFSLSLPSSKPGVIKFIEQAKESGISVSDKIWIELMSKADRNGYKVDADRKGFETKEKAVKKFKKDFGVVEATKTTEEAKTSTTPPATTKPATK